MGTTNLTQAQWLKLPQKIRESLQGLGVSPSDLNTNSVGAQPYTQAGAASLKGQYGMPSLDPSIQGVTVRGDDSPQLSSTDSVVLLQPNADAITKAHEMEHVLANQGLGSSSRLNTLWDKSVGADGAQRGEIVDRLLAHAPYLAEKWGLDKADTVDGYFSKQVAARPDKKNFLYEQLATLSALEQVANRSLTDDPYIRKHVLKTPAEREAYNAMTGLRQTRLDAKDLPPYTRQKEKAEAPTAPKGMWEKITTKAKGFL